MLATCKYNVVTKERLIDLLLSCNTLTGSLGDLEVTPRRSLYVFSGGSNEQYVHEGLYDKRLVSCTWLYTAYYGSFQIIQ